MFVFFRWHRERRAQTRVVGFAPGMWRFSFLPILSLSQSDGCLMSVIKKLVWQRYSAYRYSIKCSCPDKNPCLHIRIIHTTYSSHELSESRKGKYGLLQCMHQRDLSRLPTDELIAMNVLPLPGADKQSYVVYSTKAGTVCSYWDFIFL